MFKYTDQIIHTHLSNFITQTIKLNNTNIMLHWVDPRKMTDNIIINMNSSILILDVTSLKYVKSYNIGLSI